MLNSEPHHIIAIGASAGGMEEINLFFEHTPLDGVAYVIIQHLSADFKSRMVELLARHSQLEVKEAENEVAVKKNVVYLIPNDKFMTIKDNTLFLTAKPRTQTPHLTINSFFISLAADCGDKAIAVVLSGLGSDGTEGIKAIKKANGMVMARNPETSAFASMPAHAIATGLVDFILEPEQMPNAIEDYIKYGGDSVMDNSEDEKNIGNIINLIKEKSPLDFSDYKLNTILRRTKRRAAQANFNSLVAYFEYLKNTPTEIEALAKDFLISVTAFFRDPEAFDFIQKKVLPQILDKIAPGEELKLWVAGCATGEEVYSMAILIAEQLTGAYKTIVVKIFATDIDSQALIFAGKGLYGNNIENNVSAERLEKYFLKEAKGYRVKPGIRKMVIFAQHDLVKNPPYCNMHFICCRNLLIYMTPVLQRKIFTMLLFGLKLDGYLFLGSSESPMPIIKNLEVVNKKWKIYKNLETKRVLNFDNFLLPELLDTKQAPALSRQDNLKNGNQSLSEAVNEALINDLDYLVICVDASKNVIKSYGDTTRFLLQKNFNTNIDELLPKPLAVAFNTLSVTALKTNQKASVSGISVIQDKKTIKVDLTVTPLTVKKEGQRFLMAAFFASEADAGTDQKTNVFDDALYLNQYTLNIEAELKELTEKLNAAYEQLDASNENLQSFNEELLSANEEMQSTNEEMQSVNEELDTINANYQLKNKELLEINDDLNNYFRSNVNGQLFVNSDLILMRFSPGTVKQINLLDTDIGRPLSNISTNIKFETIINDVKAVIADGNIVIKEIETNDGKWYQSMTMPYVQQLDNKTTGAIVTFNDITELKNTQNELDKKNKSLLRINGDLDNFIHTASHDLMAPLNNIETSIEIMSQINVTDATLNKFLVVINTSIKKFRKLIKDISIISKIENDVINPEVVNVAELIDNIEWSLDQKIKSTGAVINRKLEVETIVFSQKNLRSILYNLISNALKFQREVQPLITVSTKSKGDMIILCVEDNGIGISKDGLEKVFDMYGRLDQEIEGAGIGLYLAKKIIDASGGEITVESKPGVGTTFTVYINSIQAHLLK